MLKQQVLNIGERGKIKIWGIFGGSFEEGWFVLVVRQTYRSESYVNISVLRMEPMLNWSKKAEIVEMSAKGRWSNLPEPGDGRVSREW